MKFFEAVPDELFSPLASPNRALYADALDVLYTAYREKLKLPPSRLTFGHYSIKSLLCIETVNQNPVK